jgi:hypothetical protein
MRSTRDGPRAMRTRTGGCGADLSVSRGVCAARRGAVRGGAGRRSHLNATLPEHFNTAARRNGGGAAQAATRHSSPPAHSLGHPALSTHTSCHLLCKGRRPTIVCLLLERLEQARRCNRRHSRSQRQCRAVWHPAAGVPAGAPRAAAISSLLQQHTRNPRPKTAGSKKWLHHHHRYHQCRRQAAAVASQNAAAAAGPSRRTLHTARRSAAERASRAPPAAPPAGQPRAPAAHWCAAPLLKARSAEDSVFLSSMAMVMGPTPPGTGVMPPATALHSSKAASPTSR